MPAAGEQPAPLSASPTLPEAVPLRRPRASDQSTAGGPSSGAAAPSGLCRHRHSLQALRPGDFLLPSTPRSTFTPVPWIKVPLFET